MKPLVILVPLALALTLPIAIPAQAAPPPGPPPGVAAPPPSPGDRAPPPPPRGPSIRIEREAGGAMRFDVHCGEVDTTKACADTTLAIFDRINGPAK